MKTSADLFSRVDSGTRVVVLTRRIRRVLAARGWKQAGAIPVRPAAASSRSVTPPPSSGRQAMEPFDVRSPVLSVSSNRSRT